MAVFWGGVLLSTSLSPCCDSGCIINFKPLMHVLPIPVLSDTSLSTVRYQSFWTRLEPFHNCSLFKAAVNADILLLGSLPTPNRTAKRFLECYLFCFSAAASTIAGINNSAEKKGVKGSRR